MSIVLKDGTVLPDLPEGYITEATPYAVILQAKTVPKFFTVQFTPDVWLFVPADIAGADAVMTESTDASKYLNTLIEQDEASWFGEGTRGAALSVGDTEPSWTVVWSNHDIVEVTGVNEETEELIYGGVYFPSSVSSVPEIMSVTGEWLVSMAGHTRRLSGTSDKFTPEQMDEFYGALVMPEAGEVVLQEKTVALEQAENTAEREYMEVTPDAGYGGLSKVTIPKVRLDMIVQIEQTTGTEATFHLEPREGFDGIGSATVTLKCNPPIVQHTKTVAPKADMQLVKPDAGYSYLTTVSVQGAPLEDKEVTPTTEEQVIRASEGYYGLGTVTVKAAESGGGGTVEELPNVMEVKF